MRRGGVCGRVARQITGRTPTTSLHRQTARRTHGGNGNGNDDGLLPEGPANPNIGPFAPELGVRHGVTGKGGKVDGFNNSVKSVFIINSVKSECDGECWPRPSGATTGLRYRLALNVSVDSAAAGGRDPRGRLVTAHGGPCVGAEKACTGAVLVAASALPGPIPAPSRGLKPIWGSTRDRGAAVLAGGVFRRGG